jgi:hypothetical protein
VTLRKPDPTPAEPDEQESIIDASEICVCNGHASFGKSSSQNALKVTDSERLPDCRHYVAVSWTWPDDPNAMVAVGAPDMYIVVADSGERV